MTVDEAIDRLITIDQLPEVGPDLCKEAEECMEVVLQSDDPSDDTFAIKVYQETVERAVEWNP